MKILIVGAGLFGGVCAHELAKFGNVTTLLEIYTLKKLKVFRFMNMGHIFSIRLIRIYGIMFSSLQRLIVIQMRLLQITTVNCITCRLI